MAKKSTGVYVVNKFNEPFELTEYNLFVKEECAKLKKQNIHIPGRGNTLVYIGELWQKKKANETAKTLKEQKANEKILREDIVRETAPASVATEKISTIQYNSGNSDLISIALREMGQPEWIQWETFQQREKRYNNLIMMRDTEKAEQESKEEIEKQRRYKIIENSRKIISIFNDNNAAYLSKSPSSKIFKGVQI